MPTANPPPGPAAGRAFDLGSVAAAVAGLAAIGACYWTGTLGPTAVAVALVALFPAYLLVVASALGVWLGYTTDATDLHPVRR